MKNELLRDFLQFTVFWVKSDAGQSELRWASSCINTKIFESGVFRRCSKQKEGNGCFYIYTKQGILKAECIYRHKHETFKQENEMIDGYIHFYNHAPIHLKTGLAQFTLLHFFWNFINNLPYWYGGVFSVLFMKIGWCNFRSFYRSGRVWRRSQRNDPHPGPAV